MATVERALTIVRDIHVSIEHNGEKNSQEHNVKLC